MEENLFSHKRPEEQSKPHNQNLGFVYKLKKMNSPATSIQTNQNK